jgi:ribosomal subunit interface protein
MQTKVTFRHTKGNHPDLQEMALDFAKGFEKYHDGIISVDVELNNEAMKIAEFTVNMQGTTLVSREASDDFKKSLHAAADKIIRQIKKWKTKNISSRTKQVDLVAKQVDLI